MRLAVDLWHVVRAIREWLGSEKTTMPLPADNTPKNVPDVIADRSDAELKLGAEMAAAATVRPAEPTVPVRIEWGGAKRRATLDLKGDPVRFLEQRVALSALAPLIGRKLTELVPQNALTWKGVVVHHSATKDGLIPDEAAITSYHMSWRYDGNAITKKRADELIAQGKGQSVTPPWLDNGYHVLIEMVGDALVVYLARPLSIVGGHCKQGQRNLSHIGVCLVGDYDATEPDVVRMSAVAGACSAYRKKYGFEKVDIEPHRQHAGWKTCPGAKFDMAKLLGTIS